MKNKINNLLEEKMWLDAQNMKNKSHIDVKDKILLKTKQQHIETSESSNYFFMPKPFNFWQIPAGVSIVALGIVLMGYFNSNTKVIKQETQTASQTQSSKHNDFELVAQNNSPRLSEKIALTNDLKYLSKIFTL